MITGKPNPEAASTIARVDSRVYEVNAGTALPSALASSSMSGPRTSTLILPQNGHDVGERMVVAHIAREHHARHTERMDICLERAEETYKTCEQLA
jgi:hypothetical protein